jgi:hypothetical protein
VSLRDAQQLQFELAPPAARREAARGAQRAQTDLVNAVVAKLGADVRPDEVAEAIRRWRHLAVLTDAEQQEFLTRNVIERVKARAACRVSTAPASRIGGARMSWPSRSAAVASAARGLVTRRTAHTETPRMMRPMIAMDSRNCAE